MENDRHAKESRRRGPSRQRGIGRVRDWRSCPLQPLTVRSKTQASSASVHSPVVLLAHGASGSKAGHPPMPGK